MFMTYQTFSWASVPLPPNIFDHPTTVCDGYENKMYGIVKNDNQKLF